jgi:hypothetical protein
MMPPFITQTLRLKGKDIAGLVGGFYIGTPVTDNESYKENNMKTQATPPSEKSYACETCQMRKKAEANPKALMSRLWRWHTGWCPGWKAYQAHLAEQAKS